MRRQSESHVVSHYLTSGDYNGLPLSRLASDLGADRKRLLEVVVLLVRAGRVSLPSPYQTNPHVKLFDVPVEEQLLRVDERELWLICLYPTPSSVSKAIDPASMTTGHLLSLWYWHTPRDFGSRSG